MQSLERSIGILRALAVAGRTELRLSDVARAVQLSKATTSRILAALCAALLLATPALPVRAPRAHCLGRRRT